MLLSRFSKEKCVFAISMPLCSGIATFEGLGAQVGATWAQKSRPNQLWGALATDRGSRPPKGAPKFTPGLPFGRHFQNFLRNSDPCSVETASGIQFDDQSDPPGTPPIKFSTTCVRFGAASTRVDHQHPNISLCFLTKGLTKRQEHQTKVTAAVWAEPTRIETI